MNQATNIRYLRTVIYELSKSLQYGQASINHLISKDYKVKANFQWVEFQLGRYLDTLMSDSVADTSRIRMRVNVCGFNCDKVGVKSPDESGCQSDFYSFVT